MNEREKIEYAKSFIDKLAQGINPLDDAPVPEEDVVNNVRITRCLYYVSELLGKMIEEEKTKAKGNRRKKRKRFFITAEQAQGFRFSEEPIKVSEISERFSELVDLSQMKRLSVTRMLRWLVYIGLLCPPDHGTHHHSGGPTEEGKRLGIEQLTYTNRYGTYLCNFYSLEAQHFIVDNVDAFMEYSFTKKAGEDEEEDEESKGY